MGRNSVEATKAFLIRAVRAMRWARVPRWRAFRLAAAVLAVPCLDLECVEALFFE
jgi:hypothetical protein